MKMNKRVFESKCRNFDNR